MQGIQVIASLNDENIGISNGPAAVLKENVSHGTSKQSSALKTARKAFGNITNTQSRGTKEAGTVKRRAFGADITNSISKPTAQKPAEAQLYARIQPDQVAVADTAALPQPWWATAQPERSAGKTWQQLQLDRERDEDADIEMTVQQLLAGMRNITARVLQVYDEESDDDDDPLNLHHTVCSLPNWSQHAEPIQANSSTDGTLPALALYDEVPLEQLLPDVELPDINLKEAATSAAEEDTPAAVCSATHQHAVGILSAVHASDGVDNSSRAVISSCSAPASLRLQNSVSMGGASPTLQGAARSIAEPAHGWKSPDPMPW